ncbi:family 20 glycosylhydrolase [Streptomyces sp. NPDC053750]|uniref:family 20 glycosylhydrolase n=1 Tax=Streptomyces sp. NPDC053750 TaxID=3365714 RepID=UPI0037D13EFD
MNAVIPAPALPATHVHAAARGPAAAGPWHLRSDPGLARTEETIRALLEPHLGIRLLPATSDDPGPVLRLTLGEMPPSPRRTTGVAPGGTPVPVDESYGLTIGPDGITCRARTDVGVFRAAITALQLIALADPEGELEPRQLSDAPHYAWRGLLVDPARCFIDPADLRRIIDLAALYKVNVLHLHLTDNEGWRIETPSTPALAARDRSGMGAFYSAEEYAALQEYAARRHITVVPEINLPGHCAALRAAVPGLPDAPAPEGVAGRFPYVPPLDLADPRTRTLVREVLADVCAMTTGPFVHIGGDEAVGITDESFAVAVRELRALVRGFGKRPIGWQETARAGVREQDLAQYWVDPEMMDLPATADDLAERPDLLAAGFTPELVAAMRRFFAPSADDLQRVLAGGGRVILSPQSHLYLDRRYAAAVVPPERAADAARLGFPSYRPRDVRHTAVWDPAGHGIPDDRIAGVEATVFGESLRSIDDLTTMLLPRLASVAETAWSGRPAAWDAHRATLARHGRLWRQRRLAYFPATDVPWL